MEKAVDLGLGTGRLPRSDARDRLFALAPPAATRPHRYWNASQWWGNQGATPRCVGYAWAHWLADGPLTHTPYFNRYGRRPVLDAHLIYKVAQRADEWPGEGYAGTSVRAGAKVLRSYGLITEYRWCWDLETLVDTVSNVGPVVVGTYWYRDMFHPDADGLLTVDGPDYGGHAYVINGVSRTRELVRVKNSWGRSWGRNGHAWLRFRDMERLINEDGEVCLAVERRTEEEE